MLQLAEDACAQPDAFDYTAAMRYGVKACMDVVDRECPYLDNSALGEVTFPPNKSSGVDYMVPYEISFETNFAERRISFPDPNSLTSAHVAMMRGARRLGRFMRDFAHSCFTVTAHEIVHLYQGALEQVDTTPLSWSAEHDASRLCALLMMEALEGTGRPGFQEEVLLTYTRGKERTFAGFDDVRKDAYNAWAAGFGLVDPGTAVARDLTFHRQIKGIISVDALAGALGPGCYRDTKPALLLMMRTLLEGRTGDVIKAGLRVPPLLAVPPRAEALLWLSEPAPADSAWLAAAERAFSRV